MLAYLNLKLGVLGVKILFSCLFLATIGVSIYLFYLWAFAQGVASKADLIARIQTRESLLASANASNNEEITSLTNRLDECTSTVAADKVKSRQAVSDLTDEKVKSAQDSQKAIHERDRISQDNPQTQAWGDVLVPSGFVDDLSVR